MNYYKLVIAYDGTAYCGWQMQKNNLSVLERLYQSFNSAFKVPVSIRGASRTDAGVHALSQVAGIRTPLSVNPEVLRCAWNTTLASDVVVRKVFSTQHYFNPWKHVQNKVYYYHFFLERPLPYWSRYGWYISQPVDLVKLQECLQVFVGVHDFRSFSTGNERGSDTIRVVYDAVVSKVPRFGCYRITISGVSFLRHMVRRIVGASLAVASRKDLSVDYLHTVLQEKNPRQTLLNAPPQGLLLHKITYHKEIHE